MLNHSQVESILKINGVQKGAPDEQIRSVLLSASYTKDEVEAALTVLRDGPCFKKCNVNGLHKLFRTDEGLKPQEISNLLGIDIQTDLIPDKLEKSSGLSVTYIISIVVFSILVAIIGVLMYMYVYKLGLFHPAVGLAFFNEL